MQQTSFLALEKPLLTCEYDLTVIVGEPRVAVRQVLSVLNRALIAGDRDASR